MPDRERVIRGLECCVAYDYKCNDCPYQDDGGSEDGCYSDELKTDALALLKAQEPRVLSVAEIVDEYITPDVIWIERRHENDIYPGVWKIDHYEMGLGGILDDLGEEIAERPDAYNVLWRCWTSRPTDEQRKKEPWDGQA